MALGEKIPVIFDAKSNGFGKVRADIAAADGAMGKAKAGAKGLGDMLHQPRRTGGPVQQEVVHE